MKNEERKSPERPRKEPETRQPPFREPGNKGLPETDPGKAPPQQDPPRPTPEKRLSFDTEKKLKEVGFYLKENDYKFITPTPESHRRILNREEKTTSPTLRDIFGWNQLFSKEDLPQKIIHLLEQSQVLEYAGDRLRSRIRFSTLGEDIFLHSAYPTADADAVFFGPDTYRFASLIRRELSDPSSRVERILDIGCGSGAGGIAALRCLGGRKPQVVFTDINAKALSFARINSALAGIEDADFVVSDVFDEISGSADLIVSNPPYLIDEKKRLYRHGGGKFGSTLSVRIAMGALSRLNQGGRLILYTGTPVIDGEPVLFNTLRELSEFSHLNFHYEEIDPDVFSEELEKPSYTGAERIAAVAITAVMPTKKTSENRVHYG